MAENSKAMTAGFIRNMFRFVIAHAPGSNSTMLVVRWRFGRETTRPAPNLPGAVSANAVLLPLPGRRWFQPDSSGLRTPLRTDARACTRAPKRQLREGTEPAALTTPATDSVELGRPTPHARKFLDRHFY